MSCRFNHMGSETVTIDQFVLEKELGEGANSTVFKAFHKSRPLEKVAIKMINNGSSTLEEISKDSIMLEAKVLRNLDHPHIIKFQEINTAGTLKIKGQECQMKFLYSVIQLAKKGVMLEYLTKGGALPEPVARYYLHQLVSALTYIHNAGYVHRDLKADNLLIGEDFELLVADFGHAAPHKGLRGDGYLLFESVGTDCYNPPETCNPRYKGKPVDQFMVGNLLFVFLTGMRPFNKASKDDTYYKHFFSKDHAGFWNAHFTMQDIKVSPEAQDLISKFLDVDPEKRITLKEAMSHPWMKGPIASVSQVKKVMRMRYEDINNPNQETLF